MSCNDFRQWDDIDLWHPMRQVFANHKLCWWSRRCQRELRSSLVLHHCYRPWRSWREISPFVVVTFLALCVFICWISWSFIKLLLGLHKLWHFVDRCDGFITTFDHHGWPEQWTLIVAWGIVTQATRVSAWLDAVKVVDWHVMYLWVPSIKRILFLSIKLHPVQIDVLLLFRLSRLIAAMFYSVTRWRGPFDCINHCDSFLHVIVGSTFLAMREGVATMIVDQALL